MKYEREYKLPVSGGNLHVGVDAKYNWYVELKGREWRPIQISDKPIWIDNRKWEKVPEKLGIEEAAWNQFRAEVQVAEAEAENDTGEAGETYPPEIVAKAKEILKDGDPVRYFLDVFNQIHVGDRELAQVMMCCVGSQHCENSQGLHPKLSGESGMGKSDAMETFIHLLPPWAYLKTSLSSKAIFYHPINPGTIIFLDDYKQNDDLDTIIKQSSSTFHKPYEHRTIDKDRAAQVMTAPPELVWAITSVDSNQDIQVLNRQVGLDVDSSEDMTKKVITHLFKAAGEGADRFPMTDEVMVCRAMVADIKANRFRVKVPFWDRIEWNDLSSRRNPSIFLDILRSMTIWKFMQRDTKDGYLIATEDDFKDAKDLYIGRADTLIDKLTKAERRLVQTLVDENGEVYKDMAASIMGVTSQRISQLIHGENGKTGLLQKLPGFEVEDVLIRDDVKSVRKKVLRFVHWSEYQRLDAYGSVVILRGKGENQQQENAGKDAKGSNEAKTYSVTESGVLSVSKVSIIGDIRERENITTSPPYEKNISSHIFPENALHPYKGEPDSESPTYDVKESPLNESEMDQVLSEMERKGEAYHVEVFEMEFDLREGEGAPKLTARGWEERSPKMYYPPSRI